MSPKRKRQIADNTKRYRNHHRRRYRYGQYLSAAKRYIRSVDSLADLADVITWIKKVESKRSSR